MLRWQRRDFKKKHERENAELDAEVKERKLRDAADQEETRYKSIKILF